ncbi:probable glucuronosyltransferase GUT1 isoform X1 [Olea europaea var. sylvestris]|uniref:probable glucuronosyltransferase GUT1 isoform X1 n=1 Tax=Olea europaea var. sylvestris TaxID=158386 RepID=UPI000C1D480D|nr:probable glucuronosyltransferase GUT1 isoform X1 [Olea europaea var. sylvestris]
MASMNTANKSTRFFPSHPHHSATFCTRIHQIAALALVVATFFLTRLFDHSLGPCSSPHFNSFADVNRQYDGVLRFGDSVGWPDRGYGTHLNLKIYVYDENEIEGLKLLLYGREGKISPEACIKGQWGTQVKIHRLLLQSRYRTRKKEEADLFFVPTSVKCVRMMGGLSDKEINQTYVKVLGQMPYFRLSGGRNHIFVFPSGAGAHLFKSWATYLNRSIILTPEGDRTDKRDTSAFNTWKDIIIPGNVDDGMTANGARLVDPLPLSKRKYLANFLGRAQGKVGRLQLIELAKQFPDKLESPELKLSGPDKLGRAEYFKHLQNAKFCLSPRGESSWTLRFYESFFVECVPVILSDQVELPFQNIVDYRQISIKWPSTRIGPELLDYLESIPDNDIEDMIAQGRKVRCLWVYAPESESCSAFTGIMWELQKKVTQFHQSTETFWLHNGSIVNRDLVEFSKWKPPLPLP